MESTAQSFVYRIPKWVLALFPLAILVVLIALFFVASPLSFFTGAFPPLEELSIQRVTFPENGRIQLSVINGGPDPVNAFYIATMRTLETCLGIISFALVFSLLWPSRQVPGSGRRSSCLRSPEFPMRSSG